MYWRPGDVYPTVTKSPIGTGLGVITSNLFRGPVDWDNSARIADGGPSGSDPGPYMYSYTMTSYGPEGNFYPGLTTIVDGTAVPVFKVTSLHGPSHKIMCAAEQTNHTPPANFPPLNTRASIIHHSRSLAPGHRIHHH